MSITLDDIATRELTARERKDLRILVQFTSVYCRKHHPTDRCSDLPGGEHIGLRPGRYPVCADCSEFLLYACERRVRCPLDPKPTCKECTVHCYRIGHREKVRDIMRFSGKYLMKRGRLDLVWHYFF